MLYLQRKLEHIVGYMIHAFFIGLCASLYTFVYSFVVRYYKMLKDSRARNPPKITQKLSSDNK